ncbi:PLP-dependent transferase [Fusarium albosuccineum]|uniref:PLP-dependent transferase n=1 Tax=Fusarium albosuccineum TaxID=1237068 RepID=A0A8H4PEP3_9HYPO|nr:PLP-dependent transferase [Fusarium albosuccineum]
MAIDDFELRDILGPNIVDTPWSHSLPPAPRHSVTSHMSGWKALVKLSERDPAHLSKIVSIYPRILLHKDCAQLVDVVTKLSGLDPKEQTCFLFPRLQVARSCANYITSPNRTDGHETLLPSTVSIRAYESSTTNRESLYLFAVMFPPQKMAHVMPWWSDTGVGISSRLAEDVLDNLPGLREVPLETPIPKRIVETPHQVLRERIAYLVERAPITMRGKKVQASDIYLFQSGMAAIYNTHQCLQRLAKNIECKSVILGVSFYETRHVLMKYGNGLQFFPNVSDVDALERYLREEKAKGRPVLSLWTECPSNPLLFTPNLIRLRHLADELGFTLVVDETIGGFCNVDVLPVADIIVTSLTKLFSGHADVMGGSVVLNPSSRIYDDFKHQFDQVYVDDLYISDAKILRHNSEDYLQRATIVNDNAKMLTDWLYKRSKIEQGSVKHVFYPTTTHSGARGNYDILMRAPTVDFRPGYGCLFSVELKSQKSAVAFYDNLHVYHGPHLGAHRTIALGYTYLIYNGDKELEMGDMGLSTAQIRISVGLEDSGTLLNVFKYAVMKADQAENGWVKTATS